MGYKLVLRIILLMLDYSVDIPDITVCRAFHDLLMTVVPCKTADTPGAPRELCRLVVHIRLFSFVSPANDCQPLYRIRRNRHLPSSLPDLTPSPTLRLPHRGTGPTHDHQRLHDSPNDVRLSYQPNRFHISTIARHEGISGRYDVWRGVRLERWPTNVSLDD